MKEFHNSEITGLAYDWFNHNLYYSELQTKNGEETSVIGVCNFEGINSVCKSLRKASMKYTQIALDPVEGNIYWVELAGKYTIKKADISVSLTSIRTLFDHDLETEPLLAIDYITNFVYAYYNGKLHWIEDSTNNHKEVRTRELRLNAPKSMDFFGSKNNRFSFLKM